jgi:hypothetical protein
VNVTADVFKEMYGEWLGLEGFPGTVAWWYGGVMLAYPDGSWVVLRKEPVGVVEAGKELGDMPDDFRHCAAQAEAEGVVRDAWYQETCTKP